MGKNKHRNKEHNDWRRWKDGTVEHISPGGSRQERFEVNGSGFHPASPQPTSTWVCTQITGCPLEKVEAKPEVIMPSTLYYALIDLARYFETEWFGYLTGTIEGRRATLINVYFPAQKATSVHCEPLETERAPEGTICAVHSHAQMQAFFSKTDDDHANWPIELVLNARGDIQGRMRVRLRCGEVELVDEAKKQAWSLLPVRP